MAGDKKIIETALGRIAELNENMAEKTKAEKRLPDIFIIFIDTDSLTKAEQMDGWERKRGALLEFNEVLLGSRTTSYSIMSHDVSQLPKIKYVITLDADTILLWCGQEADRNHGPSLHRPVIDEQKE